MQGKRQKLDLEPVYDVITKLLLNKNPEQISFSLAARKTQIPRTTLYYYFDSKIENLIKESVRHSIKKLMQLWDQAANQETHRFTSWKEIQEYKFNEAIKMTLKEPWNLQLYFRYCRDASYVGEEIRSLKDTYLVSTERIWSQFHEETLSDKDKLLLSNMKLGILWGLLDVSNTWRDYPQELSHLSTEIFSHLLSLSKQRVKIAE